jgi:phosphoglycerol geranylgeranyltransferase
MKVLNQILKSKQAGKKQIALLIDPDKFSKPHYTKVFAQHTFDLIFVGGSIITKGDFEKTLTDIKELAGKIPLIIFPGDEFQISKAADAILFLSLISGRNADLLIGKHVIAAPKIRKAKLESISTGYILIESGKPTTVSYMTQTIPIPNNKPEIAAATALAGEMLGMRMIYVEAGSGAEKSVETLLIKAVSDQINVPLIVGGGIHSISQIQAFYKAGADVVVVGTHFESQVMIK